MVRELADLLVNGRINKIYQPSPTDLIMQIRCGGKNHRLLISANPTYPRIYVTNASFANPTEPPMFCMLLRKHCEGALIEGIHQEGMERVITMDIIKRDELGDDQRKKIIIEIMGRHSNIILIDEKTRIIIDGIQHVTPAISSYRVVLPGRPYLPPPPQDKINPLEGNEETFIKLLHLNEGKIEKQLVSRFTGLSPQIGKEIVYRAGLPTREALWKAFQSVIHPVKEHQYEPAIYYGGTKPAFSVVPLLHLQEYTKETFPTVSECLEGFYQEKAEQDVVKQKMHNLIRFLSNERNKNATKIEKLQQTKLEALDGEKYRLYGELLTANLYQIQRGQTEVEVYNYYEEEPSLLTISLNPGATPSENAQAYFKKYNKAKNSLEIVDQQMALAQQEVDYLDTILQQLEGAGVKDLEEIQEELIEEGYLKNRNKKGPRKTAPKKPTLEQYTSSEGIHMIVGKNNKQNDYLTHKIADDENTWLHTKDIPGSHVIIRSHEFGDATLYEAAQLAAYYSKGKNSSQVPVDYTLVRHVKKVRGAKPGFVTYDHQKTLYITPDDGIIRKLNETKKLI
jgi:predicted ribosome quality control (RQC) complex YloA/Tae2 family protein